MEPARGPVTVVRAQTPARKRGSVLTSALVLLGVAAFVFLTGDPIFAGIIVVGGVVVYPLMRRAANRAAARQPDWIEVRADRISAVWAAGHSSELVRTEGSVLQARQLGAEPRLYLVGAAGDDGSIGLGRFDVEQIGTAAMAHGWQWIPPDSAALLGPGPATEPATGPGMSVVGPSAEAGPDELRIQLRDGGHRFTIGQRGMLLIIVPFVVLVLALSFSGVPTAAIVITTVGAGVLIGLGIVGMVLVSMRRGSAAVIVGPHRLAVKYGSLSAHVVERSAIGSASVGSRWARMRSPQGRQLIWVPLKPKRDEVLAALQRYGWPVSESPAGFQRH